MSTRSDRDLSLTANAFVVDRPDERLGELHDASSLLGDQERLRAAMQDRGHLFFSGLIDPAVVGKPSQVAHQIRGAR